MSKKKKEELHRGEKTEKQKEKNEKEEISIISDELIRWMTEGTSPYSSPRSDCG